MLPGAAAETLLEPGPVRRLLAGFPALRHRNFRLFVVGQGISLVGFWMQSVAQGWLVYRLEGRALDLDEVERTGLEAVDELALRHDLHPQADQRDALPHHEEAEVAVVERGHAGKAPEVGR